MTSRTPVRQKRLWVNSWESTDTGDFTTPEKQKVVISLEENDIQIRIDNIARCFGYKSLDVWQKWQEQSGNTIKTSKTYQHTMERARKY